MDRNVGLARPVVVVQGGGVSQAAAGTLRMGVEQVARSFIAGTNTAEVLKVVEGFHRQGLAFTVDVLGEATLSEDEAEAYQRRYLELLEALTARAPAWSSAMMRMRVSVRWYSASRGAPFSKSASSFLSFSVCPVRRYQWASWT